MFDVLKNTAEGLTEAAINGVKMVASPVPAVVDEDAPEDAYEGVRKGIQKIGKTDEGMLD